jgi:hypothetical protein
MGSHKKIQYLTILRQKTVNVISATDGILKRLIIDGDEFEEGVGPTLFAFEAPVPPIKSSGAAFKNQNTSTERIIATNDGNMKTIRHPYTAWRCTARAVPPAPPIKTDVDKSPMTLFNCDDGNQVEIALQHDGQQGPCIAPLMSINKNRIQYCSQ